MKPAALSDSSVHFFCLTAGCLAGGNWLTQESGKRDHAMKAGEERAFKQLKPLSDVIDLRSPAEVRRLAQIVPCMKAADGGD